MELMMELTGIVITIALVVLAWRESKASLLRTAAIKAVLACEEEIQALRGGVMSGMSDEKWRSDRWEHRRQDLLLVLARFHRAHLDSNRYDEMLMQSIIPSFQDENERRKWEILGKGPYASQVESESNGNFH
jgi:uncharacterized membrane protein YccC